MNSSKTLSPNHAFVRRFMAFDRHMNLVLGDAEEYRKLPPKKGKSEDEVLPHLSSPLQLRLESRTSTHTGLPLRQSRKPKSVHHCER